MADRDVAQEVVLAEETEFKIRRADQTDYAVLDDVIDDSVSFEPSGNEARSFEAISGNAYEIPGKIKTLSTTFPIWVTLNELEVFRSVFGEPTDTGTYVHTFNIETIGQDIDFVITGPRYGSSTEDISITGTDATIRLTNLNIEKGGIWKFSVEITVSAQNTDLAITSDTDLNA